MFQITETQCNSGQLRATRAMQITHATYIDDSLGWTSRSTLLYPVSLARELCYLGAETDDQQRNPNTNKKDHQVDD